MDCAGRTSDASTKVVTRRMVARCCRPARAPNTTSDTPRLVRADTTSGAPRLDSIVLPTGRYSGEPCGQLGVAKWVRRHGNRPARRMDDGVRLRANLERLLDE